MTDSWTDGAQSNPGTSITHFPRGSDMTDRVSVSITIGGELSADLLDNLIRIAHKEGLTAEWGGEPLDHSDLAEEQPLKLFAHEVANGEIHDIEDFCCENDLPFLRWAGAAPGAFPAEIVIWPGEGPRRSFTADDDGNVVLTAAELSTMTSMEAIREHFEAGTYEPPALRIIAGDAG